MTMNDSIEIPINVGIASRTRRMMYVSMGVGQQTRRQQASYEECLPTRLLTTRLLACSFLEEELTRVDQPVVAEGVVVDVAGQHVSEVVLDDPRRDALADHADRHRRLLVDVDDLLEQGVVLGLV